MSGLIEKYAAVRLHTDPNRVEQLQQALGRMTKHEAEDFYAGSPTTGHCFLQHSPGEVDCVLETVMDGDQGDSISALYAGLPMFAERSQYVAARAELIDFVNDVSTDRWPRCAIRGRHVPAKYLSTVQLIQLAKVLLTNFFDKKSAH